MLCVAVCLTTDVSAGSSCGAGEKTWNANAADDVKDDEDFEEDDPASSVCVGGIALVLCARERRNAYGSRFMKAETSNLEGPRIPLNILTD